MIRQAMLWVLVAAGALLAAGGCGRVNGSDGSNTNWFRRCDTDADCATGECWCHACSTPCTASSECPGKSCRETGELGCGQPSKSPMLCVAECTTPADCRSQGTGVECVNGACLPPATPQPGETGDAGTSSPGTAGDSSAGTGGQNGSSGGGGTTSGGGGEGGGDETGGSIGAGGGPPLGSVDPVARVALTESNTCVVSGGKVYCFGNNQSGQLGFPPPYGTMPSWTDTPSEVSGLVDIVSVALGLNHACAFDQRGDVFCWGGNGVGQVGSESEPENTCVSEFGDIPCQPTPTKVPGVDHVVELALLVNQSCARLEGGAVRCWGDVEALSTWAASVTSATGLTLALAGACATTAGDAVSCSFDLPSSVVAAKPRRLVLSGNYDGAGSGFGCALGADGSVTCFGDNTLGQLGDDAGLSPSALTEGAVELSLGTAHACALDSNGAVVCWGRNYDGEVGGYPEVSPNCSNATCERSPRLVEGGPAFVTIGAGTGRTCGLAANDTLWCWGDIWSSGAPSHLAGPWEPGGDACFTTINAALEEGPFENAVGCATDSDCISVSLDLSCNHSCGAKAVSKADAPALIEALSEVEAKLCPAAEAAGCPSEPLTCPVKQPRAFCDTSGCRFDDPERTGCTDHCACALVRRTPTVTALTCDGFDLILVDGEPCPTCNDSWVYLLVGNYGTRAFDGTAVLSFDRLDGISAAPVVPDPVPLALELEPGEFAPLIRVDSTSRGVVQIRITAAGDCQPDGDIWVELPEPTNPCQ